MVSMLLNSNDNFSVDKFVIMISINYTASYSINFRAASPICFGSQFDVSFHHFMFIDNQLLLLLITVMLLIVRHLLSVAIYCTPFAA